MTMTHNEQTEAGSTAPVEPSRWSRRNILRAVGIGGATVAVAGTGVLSYRVFDTAVLDPGGGPAFDPWTNGGTRPVRWARLRRRAGREPAQHPAVDLRRRRRTIDIYVDPSRTPGASIRRAAKSTSAWAARWRIWCSVAGPRTGPTVTLLPDGAGGTRVAHVDAVRRVHRRRARCTTRSGDRHTNRGPYDGTAGCRRDPFGPRRSPDCPGSRCTGSPNRHRRRSWCELLIDAAEALTADEQQSRDGFAWFRSSNDEIQRYRDGLVLDGQGLGPLVLGMAKLLPASSPDRRRPVLGRADQDRAHRDRRRVRRDHHRTARRSPAQLDAGRLLQRIHLTATSQGIALQHMNQITERIDREATTGAAPTFAPRFAELLPPGATPLLTFRVGYPVRAGRPTPRR